MREAEAELLERLGVLEQHAAELVDRVRPVLVPDDDMVTTDKELRAPRRSGSDICGRIRTWIDHVESIDALLVSTLHRVDL